MKSNTKNILWGVGISLVVLVGLAYFTTRSSGAPQSGAKTALAASELQYDFGTVSMAKGKVMHEFKVKNTSSAPVTIARVYTSCMCTQANLITKNGGAMGPFGMMGMGYVPTIAETLAPGEEGTIQAIFDPAAHGPAGVGPIERQVTVETKDGADPLVLDFRAVVSP